MAAPWPVYLLLLLLVSPLPVARAALAAVHLVPTADDIVEGEACRQQSRILAQHLASYEAWALQMYDASAKWPSGLLSGNAFQLGDFDECLGVDVRLRPRRGDASAWDVVAEAAEPEVAGALRIRGRYCLAFVDLELGEAGEALPAARTALDQALAHSFIKSSANDWKSARFSHAKKGASTISKDRRYAFSGRFVPRFSTPGWGVCVPSGCSARDVEAALRAAESRFQRSEAWGAGGVVRARFSVDERACRAADDPIMTTTDWSSMSAGFLVASTAALILAALTVAATVVDVLGRGRSPGAMRVLGCFSLRRNMGRLMADKVDADDIGCLHGIRTFCSLVLFLTHTGFPFMWVPLSNRRWFMEAAEILPFLPLRAATLHVDTFLVVSAALATLGLCRQLARGQGLDIPRRLASRVVRVAPSLAAVLAVHAFFLERVGSGPLWWELVEENGRVCRDHMWRNLLYVHTFWPLREMCAPHTHSLAADMQLWLLGPPLAWLLVRSRALGLAALLAVVGAASWLRRQATLCHGVSLLMVARQSHEGNHNVADYAYLMVSYRASAYAIGVALGYALYLAPRRLHLPKGALLLGWALSAALGGWALFGFSFMARLDYSPDIHDAATFNTFAPLASAASVSWLIFACYTGNGGLLDRFLSSRPMVLFARISYSFFLTQFIVFFYNGGSTRSSKPFSLLSALDMGQLSSTILISTALTVLVELPVSRLRSLHSGRPASKERRETPVPAKDVANGTNGSTNGVRLRAPGVKLD